MKLDIIDFLGNYNLFYSITGDFYEAVGMYIFTVAFVFVVAFAINGLTFGRLPSFKEKSNFMSTTLVIFIAVIGEAFYSFLEFFKIPLAWVYEHWLVLLISVIAILILYGLIAFIIEERKYNKNTEDKKENDITDGNQ